MPAGPGRYGAECDALRKMVGLEDGSVNTGAVVLVVIGGNKGSGVSFHGEAPVILAVPRMLRALADQMEEQFVTGRF